MMATARQGVLVLVLGILVYVAWLLGSMALLGTSTWEVPISIKSATLTKSETARGTDPLGARRHKYDYEWSIFGGHAETSMQLHFSQLQFSEPGTTLTIADASGAQQVTLTSSDSADDFWTPVINSNSVTVRFQENSPIDSSGDRFVLDRIRLTSSVRQWLENYPTGDVVTTGNTPNVQITHSDSQSQFNNREFGGVIKGGAEQYFISELPISDELDVAIVEAPSIGLDRIASSDKNLIYGSTFLQRLAGRFGNAAPANDQSDDVIVISDTGEIYLSINDSGSYLPFTIVARNFYLLPNENVFVADINADQADDLLFVSSSEIRYLLNGGPPSDPVFGPIRSQANPIDSSIFTTPTKYNFITGDFDTDGYSDIVMIADVNTEPSYSEPNYNNSGYADRINLILNDQAGNFVVGPQIQYRGMGFIESYSDWVKSFHAGDFDGDGDIDLLSLHEPGWNTDREVLNSTDRIAIDVSLNRQGAADWTLVPFEQFRIWDSIGIQAGTDRYRDILHLVTEDFDADGRTDYMTASQLIESANSFFRYRSIPGTRKLLLKLAGVSAATFRPDFVQLVDLTIASMPDQFTPIDVYGNQRPGLLAVSETNPYRGVSVHVQIAAGPDVSIAHPQDRTWGVRPIIKFGDFDSDDEADAFIFTGDYVGSVEVLVNDGAGLLDRLGQRAYTAFGKYFEGEFRGYEFPELGDVNGDGFDDLILFVLAGSPSFGTGNLGDIGGVYVALNDQTGNFSPMQLWNSALAQIAGAADSAYPDYNPKTLVGDFNRDGLDDVGVAFYSNYRSYFRIAYSTSTRFGPTIDTIDIDTVTGFWSSYHDPAFIVADENGDGWDDVIVHDTFFSFGGGLVGVTGGQIDSFRFRQGGQIDSSRQLVDYVKPGRIEGAWLAAGNHTGIGRADLSLYLSEVARIDMNNVQSWLNGGSDDAGMFDIGQSFQSSSYEPNTYLRSADLDADQRDEIVLVQPKKHRLEVFASKVSYVDLDLSATPWIHEIPMDSIPYSSNETLESAVPFHSTESLFNLKSSNFKPSWILKVTNRGRDPGFYKLIANRVREKVTIDALVLMKPNELVFSWFDHYEDVMREASTSFYDAVDGYGRIDKVQFWIPGDNESAENWKNNTCDSRIDAFLCTDKLSLCPLSSDPDNKERAHAKFACSMKIFRQNDGEVVVHEYGHFGFGMKDEYCENGNNNAKPCGSAISHENSVSVCPHSMMANSNAREFCTILNHDGLGKIKQNNKARWEQIPFVSPASIPQTPNPHKYLEPVFLSRMEDCDGEC